MFELIILIDILFKKIVFSLQWNIEIKELLTFLYLKLNESFLNMKKYPWINFFVNSWMSKNYKIYSLVNLKKNCFIFKVFFFIWKLCKIICTKSQVTIAENLNLKMTT